ncbi:MAG: hypothetical protein LW832_01940 [Parachlamydia sp.]|jgi:DNA-directed RNA polymerase subunit omega|nr:hypothetical protein [Parachlamydia sp.]
MEKKDKFTNEKLAKKFKSNFELVNYAIKLAENMIRTGRDARVKSEVQNRAMLILEEISEGKDHFDEIQENNINRAPDHETSRLMADIMQSEREEKKRSRAAAFLLENE